MVAHPARSASRSRVARCMRYTRKGPRPGSPATARSPPSHQERGRFWQLPRAPERTALFRGLSVSHIFRWTLRPHLQPLPISRGEWQGIGSLPSPLGLSVSRSGASTSRSGTGEGSLAQFREPTSSVAPRSSPAVQSNSTPRPGFAGETGGEPLPSVSGRATRTMSRFELRFGCAARGGPHGQRETIADAEL